MARCGGCHLKDTAGAGMLSMGTQAQLAYDALVGQMTVNVNCNTLKRVDTAQADPMQSSLYLKIVGTTCGKRMPAGMNMPPPLTDEQIMLVGRWISEGAQNN
jgi:hypothetical protein